MNDFMIGCYVTVGVVGLDGCLVSLGVFRRVRGGRTTSEEPPDTWRVSPCLKVIKDSVGMDCSSRAWRNFMGGSR